MAEYGGDVIERVIPMTKILIVSLSDFGSDPRVDRQVAFLADDFEVVAAGFGPPRQSVEFIELTQPSPEKPWRSIARGVLSVALKLSRSYERAYWRNPRWGRWSRELERVRPDLVLVNDAIALPLGMRASHGAPVLFDAHEYAPSEFDARGWRQRLAWSVLIRPLVIWICRTYIPQTSGMMTVSDGIAAAYARDTGVHATVVTNAPAYRNLAPSPTDPQRVRMVHWGIADPQRHLEWMLEMMSLLDARFTLDLLLVGGDDYVKELKRRAAHDDRIRFLPPIPMLELPVFGNGYDVGVFLLPAEHVNQEFVLPNKFFEYVQACLAVAIGPSPEMARLARSGDFGVVSADFAPASLAAELLCLDADRLVELKHNAAAAARELCAENNRGLVLDLVAHAQARQAGDLGKR